MVHSDGHVGANDWRIARVCFCVWFMMGFVSLQFEGRCCRYNGPTCSICRRAACRSQLLRYGQFGCAVRRPLWSQQSQNRTCSCLRLVFVERGGFAISKAELEIKWIKFSMCCKTVCKFVLFKYRHCWLCIWTATWEPTIGESHALALALGHCWNSCFVASSNVGVGNEEHQFNRSSYRVHIHGCMIWRFWWCIWMVNLEPTIGKSHVFVFAFGHCWDRWCCNVNGRCGASIGTNS